MNKLCSTSNDRSGPKGKITEVQGEYILNLYMNVKQECLHLVSYQMCLTTSPCFYFPEEKSLAKLIFAFYVNLCFQLVLSLMSCLLVLFWWFVNLCLQLVLLIMSCLFFPFLFMNLFNVIFLVNLCQVVLNTSDELFVFLFSSFLHQPLPVFD